MACGCPVITNGKGALKETVRDKQSGFIVDSLDEAEELIKTDAVSKLKTADIVKQGGKFSIEKSAAGHLQCLEDVHNKAYW
jgi:glycosyltransferase involved in cell wall biosynthesis